MPAPTTIRPTRPATPATASPAASSHLRGSPPPYKKSSIGLDLRQSANDCPRPASCVMTRLVWATTAPKTHGQRQIGGRAAALPAFVDLPADAHHADVYRPPHLGV